MKKLLSFFGLYYEPNKKAKVVLGMIPFIMLIAVYSYSSIKRHEENEQDKLIPTWTQMVDQVKIYVFEKDKRSDQNLFLEDTKVSLKRLLLGTVIAAGSAMFWGMMMGVFPWFRIAWLPFTTFMSIVPPLAVLPIIFIAFGVEETAKISLIVIGISLLMSRDVNLAVSSIPREHTVKGLTLGAGSVGIIWRIIFPQVMPRFLEMVKIYLSPAWLFLIAAEAIASQSGLAYRIFLSQRYLNMALIIPIVLWITILGFSMNFAIKKYIQWRYLWYVLQVGK